MLKRVVLPEPFGPIRPVMPMAGATEAHVVEHLEAAKPPGDEAQLKQGDIRAGRGD